METESALNHRRLLRPLARDNDGDGDGDGDRLLLIETRAAQCLLGADEARLSLAVWRDEDCDG